MSEKKNYLKITNNFEIFAKEIYFDQIHFDEK
jgi:hypothetical protein